MQHLPEKVRLDVIFAHDVYVRISRLQEDAALSRNRHTSWYYYPTALTVEAVLRVDKHATYPAFCLLSLAHGQGGGMLSRFRNYCRITSAGCAAQNIRQQQQVTATILANFPWFLFLYFI